MTCYCSAVAINRPSRHELTSETSCVQPVCRSRATSGRRSGDSMSDNLPTGSAIGSCRTRGRLWYELPNRLGTSWTTGWQTSSTTMARPNGLPRWQSVGCCNKVHAIQPKIGKPSTSASAAYWSITATRTSCGNGSCLCCGNEPTLGTAACNIGRTTPHLSRLGPSIVLPILLLLLLRRAPPLRFDSGRLGPTASAASSCDSPVFFYGDLDSLASVPGG